MSLENRFEVISPVSGLVHARESYSSPAAVQAALDLAEQSFRSWRTSSPVERADLATALAGALTARREELAAEIAWSIGRPIAQSDETPRFATVTEKHIEAARTLDAVSYPSDDGIERFVRRNGQGVHFSISPWNYPLGMLPWLVVAPILGGNTVLFKHAEQTTGVGRILQEAYDEIGGPAGVLQTLRMDHDAAGALIATGRLKSVNFIGSVRGGLQVHRAAAGTLTHVHLELGGKDPAYVRADANLESAVANIADGSFSNAGQSCCSVERIYVHASVHHEFVERLKAEAGNFSIGNPITDNPAVGTVVRQSAADYINDQVAAAVAAGATAHTTAQAADFVGAHGGCYVAPVILTGVDHGMSIMRDELFGPAACVQRVADDEEAVRLMNDSEFGLTASVWTRDLARGVEIAERIETGTAFVNRCDHADLYLPWGGNKMSGIGRANGREGLMGVTETKSFHVKAA